MLMGEECLRERGKALTWIKRARVCQRSRRRNRKYLSQRRKERQEEIVIRSPLAFFAALREIFLLFSRAGRCAPTARGGPGRGCARRGDRCAGRLRPGSGAGRG